MESNPEIELKKAVDRILQSDSRKKLIVAGPGTGKTTVFRQLLESTKGDNKTRLVLTFINNLKSDLEKSLSDIASVYTLHGYCQALLHRNKTIREGLTDKFRCLPGLVSLIKQDWIYLKNKGAPQFVELMRSLNVGEELDFYNTRSNYYDAVDFDDSVFRVFQQLKKNRQHIPLYDLLLIDEYQDFNRMEAAFIELLAERSPIVIAGDDDQALYSQLRGSSWEFIRSLHGNRDYEKFELPFCMRCPAVIVGAVNDIVVKARQLRKLQGRIEKPYLHYEPKKGADSKRYPKIGLVQASVQRLNANYFGRFIEQAIKQIRPEEVKEANENGEPAALIIGSKQYLRQVHAHLIGCGYTVEEKQAGQDGLDRKSGIEILGEDSESNLGWRIILEFEKPSFTASIIKEAAKQNVSLAALIPVEMRSKVLEEVKTWVKNAQQQKNPSSPAVQLASGQPRIKVTSFEGAKGLSAQHVFIVGMHKDELPHDAAQIQDIEICRFVVGLTRTKKKCSLLCTNRFADKWKQPSVFLSWIKSDRYEITKVDASYWGSI